MSEQPTPAAAPETAAQELPPSPRMPPAPRSYALPVAAVSLLLTVVLAVGGYFIWHEVRRQADWQQQVLGQIEARGQSLDQRIETFKGRLDADLAAADRGRRELQDAQRDLARAQTGLEDALGVLRAQVSRQHADWMLAEVQYLLQVANLRVQLERDVPTALAALGSADQRLQALSDPAYTAVREEIARELAALRAVALPDVPGIALTLESLAAEVEKLPLANAHVHEPATTGAAAPATAPDGWWERIRQTLDNVGTALRSLVVVRRNDVPVGPLLAPEQQFFLYENLRLQLATARLAALRGATDVYRASLRAAVKWLTTYFDAQTATVAAAVAELERLAAQDIAPVLPDVSASLRLLRERMQQTPPPVGSRPDTDAGAGGDARSGTGPRPEADDMRDGGDGGDAQGEAAP